MPHDPRCVLVTDDNGFARIVAQWLSVRGIPASAHFREVRVIDPAQIDDAMDLLEREGATIPETASREVPELIRLRCSRCGQMCVFDADQGGTRQECVHCGMRLNVP